MENATQAFQNKLVSALKKNNSATVIQAIKRDIRERDNKLPKLIKAFGKTVSRDEAYEIIINNKINEICRRQKSENLYYMLMFGWESLVKRTNKELERFIKEHLIED